MDGTPGGGGAERNLRRREARAEQTYRRFLKDVEARGRLSPELAERAAVAVLRCLEQRILPDEARHLEAQLPLKLQVEVGRAAGLHEGPESFDRDELLERVGRDLGMMADEVEPLVRAVLVTIREHVSEGEFDDVAGQLPEDWADLWRFPI